MRSYVAGAWLLFAFAAVAGPSPADGQSTFVPVTETGFVPVTQEMLENPPASEWLMFRRTLDSWGYSPLDQIDRENVHQLSLAWAREVGVGTSEITPLAYNGVLYIPSVDDVIEAVDSTTGDFIWRYTREIPEGLYAQVGFNAKNNRNIAIYDRLILNNSDDNYAFALDAETGEMVWETQILDWQVNPRHPQLRPDRRRRPGGLRQELPSLGWAGFLHHDRARCPDRQGTLASAHDAGARRARRRDLGRCAVREAAPRRHLDGAQL